LAAVKTGIHQFNHMTLDLVSELYFITIYLFRCQWKYQDFKVE
jgi:hypothetical protein